MSTAMASKKKHFTPTLNDARTLATVYGGPPYMVPDPTPATGKTGTSFQARNLLEISKASTDSAEVGNDDETPVLTRGAEMSSLATIQPQPTTDHDVEAAPATNSDDDGERTLSPRTLAKDKLGRLSVLREETLRAYDYLPKKIDLRAKTAPADAKATKEKWKASSAILPKVSTQPLTATEIFKAKHKVVPALRHTTLPKVASRDRKNLPGSGPVESTAGKMTQNAVHGITGPLLKPPPVTMDFHEEGRRVLRDFINEPPPPPPPPPPLPEGKSSGSFDKAQLVRSRLSTPGTCVSNKADEHCFGKLDDYKEFVMLGKGAIDRTFSAHHRGSNQRVLVKLTSTLALCCKSPPAKPKRCVDTRKRNRAGSQEYVYYQKDWPKPWHRYYIKYNVETLRLEVHIANAIRHLSKFVSAHADLPPIMDREKGEFGLVMAYQPGSTLAQLLRHWQMKFRILTEPGRSRRAMAVVEFLTAQIAEAVRFLHSVGVVHRDIKLANIQVGYYGYLQLGEYGHSYVEDDECLNVIFRYANQRKKQVLRKTAAAPEEMWNRYLRERNKTSVWPHWPHCYSPPLKDSSSFLTYPDNHVQWLEKIYLEPPLSVPVGKHTDLYRIGYTVLSMDFPFEDHDLSIWDPESMSFRKKRSYEDFSRGLKRGYVPRAMAERPVLLDFVMSLLSAIPSERPGFHNTEELLKHELFSEIDFERLRQKKIAPPWPFDTGNGSWCMPTEQSLLRNWPPYHQPGDDEDFKTFGWEKEAVYPYLCFSRETAIPLTYDVLEGQRARSYL